MYLNSNFYGLMFCYGVFNGGFQNIFSALLERIFFWK